MSHDWAWAYGPVINAHKDLFQVGDPVILYARDDKTATFRKALPGEIPEAFVQWKSSGHDIPGMEEVYAEKKGQSTEVKIAGLTGLDVLPHESQVVWYRPSLAAWHGDKGKDGIWAARQSTRNTITR